MIKRDLQEKAMALLEKFPFLVVSGPRQSGKTTFAKMIQPEYSYVNLKLPEERKSETGKAWNKKPFQSSKLWKG